MRARPGDEVMVFDGAGHVAPARVKTTSPAVLEITGEVEEKVRRNRLTLIQALPKGHRMDLIVEKGTELGLQSLVPVITVNTVSRPKGEQAAKKVERWNRIALSAARQCGTPWIPDITPVTSYESALGSKFDLLLIGSLSADARPLHDVLNETPALRDGNLSIAIIIGPEGDLADSETAEAVDKGAVPVSFGELVLRVETAAIYSLSVLSYEIGRRPGKG